MMTLLLAQQSLLHKHVGEHTACTVGVALAGGGGTVWLQL